METLTRRIEDVTSGDTKMDMSELNDDIQDLLLKYSSGTSLQNINVTDFKKTVLLIENVIKDPNFYIATKQVGTKVAVCTCGPSEGCTSCSVTDLSDKTTEVPKDNVGNSSDPTYFSLEGSWSGNSKAVMPLVENNEYILLRFSNDARSKNGLKATYINRTSNPSRYVFSIVGLNYQYIKTQLWDTGSYIFVGSDKLTLTNVKEESENTFVQGAEVPKEELQVIEEHIEKAARSYQHSNTPAERDLSEISQELYDQLFGYRDSQPETPLQRSSAYSLTEVFKELKFGRPGFDQQFLNECIKKLQTSEESN